MSAGLSRTVRHSATSRTRLRHRRHDQAGTFSGRSGSGGSWWRAGRPRARLRPESEWELLDVEGGGRYVARREPSVELLLAGADTAQVSGAGAVLVVDTHDLARAAELAWPIWSGRCPGLRLSWPQTGWWRAYPADRALVGAGVERMWWPARPGGPGAVPGVEFVIAARPACRDDVSGPAGPTGPTGPAGGER